MFIYFTPTFPLAAVKKHKDAIYINKNHYLLDTPYKISTPQLKKKTPFILP